ncbi:signal peptidase II [Nocardioides perillae]|uniref:Lipoprotein signal peptidase n=1 Tax=Nocardioides perillae TaxID=1119534 RepID=A0A7Y9UVA8_9ACTN|nr:signal peptidase II [Nocardioides perillae]NYG56220.1 signal peptidase II [Nocardioides perillae]
MQAARGASLTGDTTTGSDPSRRTRARLLLAGVALTAYAVDVVSKVVAVEQLEGRAEPVPVVGEVLQLTLVRNPGAAFGTGTQFTVALSVFAAVAAVVVLVLARRVRSTLWAVGLGALLAGVLGNLTDRLLREPGPMRGHVVDMFLLPNWPVFNVADVCINAAAAVILVQAFRGIRLDGTRESDHRADESEPTA